MTKIELNFMILFKKATFFIDNFTCIIDNNLENRQLDLQFC